MKLMRLLLVTLAATVLRSAAGDVPPGWAAVYGYMVQDVCLDASGRVVVGLSPLAPACQRHRDLAPGEALPYHKADWPGDADLPHLPGGYQRSDSFPARSALLGEFVVQTFDFGVGGRTFGVFDPGDGGQVVAFSPNSASIVLTEDGGGGLQLMAGPTCTAGSVSAARLLDSWELVAHGTGTLYSGATLARLRIVTTSACPSAFDFAYTEWHIAQLRYRASLGGQLTAPLSTLVSDHFGGQSVATADHLERFYFTHELGWTRWERWQGPKYINDPARVTQAALLAASGRCRPLEPAPGANWLMVDCREWTNIVKPDAAGGDPPDFWIDRLRGYALTKALFAN